MQQWKKYMAMLTAAIAVCLTIVNFYNSADTDTISNQNNKADTNSQEISRCLHGCAGCFGCHTTQDEFVAEGSFTSTMPYVINYVEN